MNQWRDPWDGRVKDHTITHAHTKTTTLISVETTCIYAGVSFVWHAAHVNKFASSDPIFSTHEWDLTDRWATLLPSCWRGEGVCLQHQRQLEWDHDHKKHQKTVTLADRNNILPHNLPLCLLCGLGVTEKGVGCLYKCLCLTTEQFWAFYVILYQGNVTRNDFLNTTFNFS